MKSLPKIDKFKDELKYFDEDYGDEGETSSWASQGLNLPDLSDADFSSVSYEEELFNNIINYDYGEAPADYGITVNEFKETGWVGDFHLDKIINEAILQGASDIDIITNQTVTIKVNGDTVRCDDYPVPSDETMSELVTKGFISHTNVGTLNNELEFDGAYVVKFGPFRGRRLRINVGLSFTSYYISMRIINETIPSFSDLGLEQDILDWASYPDGLVLLCGPTGAGKSTTLASVIRKIQETTRKKIITIEKPVEYVYPDDSESLVVQREVGTDTHSFENGLTSAMRQAPNIIMIGEVRNTAEFRELMRASETGHLSVSTMHTNSVPTTLNRIQSLFEGGEQTRVLSVLADTLRGVGNQILVKTKDGEGRFAVRELLTINQEIKGYIEKGDIASVRDYQERHSITMEHGLMRAIEAGKCTLEEALGHSSRPDYLRELLRG